MCIVAKDFTLNISECSSSGIISTTDNYGGGGIIGYRAFQQIENGTITVSDCYSTGIMNAQAGGIFGKQGGQEMVSGSISVSDCYSTGELSGQYSGGIFGSLGGVLMSGGSISVSECYSTGELSGQYSGGIFGDGGYQMSGGSISVSDCYSTGELSGTSSGGIFGPDGGYQMSDGSISVSDCYSTGIISGQFSGGIFGTFGGYQMSGGSISVSDCYSTGELSGESVGGIVGRSFCDSMNNQSILNTIKNCYSTGNITNKESGGICAGYLASNAVNGKLSVENCYSLGKIEGEDSGGIIGSNSGFNPDTSNVVIELKNSYSIGSVTGNNAGGIYGPNKTIGSETNCISSNNNTWSDTQAVSTLQTNSSSWIDISSSTNVPWLLKSFDAPIYSPDNLTNNTLSGNIYYSNGGLFNDTSVIDYTYTLLKVNNSYTIPSGISINTTNGQITFNDLSNATYTVQTLVGEKFTINTVVSYKHYQINTYTLTLSPFSTNLFYSTSKNTKLSITLNGFGSNISYVISQEPSYGTLKLNQNNSYTYTPLENYLGNDFFTYYVKDNQNNSNVSTVNISVLDPNQQPNVNPNNTFYGSKSLPNNVSNNNSAFGVNVLEENNVGYQNTGVGANTLNKNQNGINNSAFGFNALENNVNGNRNCGVGAFTLRNNVDENNNIAIGFKSGTQMDYGSNNILIGVESNVINANAFNQILIGTNTSPSSDNIFQCGNKNTTSIDPSKTNQTDLGSSNYRYKTIYSVNAVNVASDRNLKENIQTCDLGLDFINSIIPVSYNKHDKTHYGVLAQDIEKNVNKEIIYEKDINNKYHVKYSELLMPIIYSLQEISNENKKIRNVLMNINK